MLSKKIISFGTSLNSDGISVKKNHKSSCSQKLFLALNLGIPPWDAQRTKYVTEKEIGMGTSKTSILASTFSLIPYVIFKSTIKVSLVKKRKFENIEIQGKHYMKKCRDTDEVFIHKERNQGWPKLNKDVREVHRVNGFFQSTSSQTMAWGPHAACQQHCPLRVLAAAACAAELQTCPNSHCTWMCSTLSDSLFLSVFWWLFLSNSAGVLKLLPT